MEPKGPNGANLNSHEDAPYYNRDFLAFICCKIYQANLKKNQCKLHISGNIKSSSFKGHMNRNFEMPMWFVETVALLKSHVNMKFTFLHCLLYDLLEINTICRPHTFDISSVANIATVCVGGKENRLYGEYVVQARDLQYQLGSGT